LACLLASIDSVEGRHKLNSDISAVGKVNTLLESPH
jgi:hypothetical protein